MIFSLNIINEQVDHRWIDYLIENTVREETEDLF